MKRFVFLILGMFAWVLASAATHTVRPGESIQSAIDLAAAGDTVEVLRGHYR